ncbi:hypothetical protein POTOM_060780 [Populus tomentosa]|uniref:Uncharacterized protein n=1 Tax=Populus tomentosa TaxID=118781 RepID=A0A8X8BVQ8_POPTO|nr:hypothetical protein POTOM_060780 [Populus tomentosa]
MKAEEKRQQARRVICEKKPKLMSVPLSRGEPRRISGHGRRGSSRTQQRGSEIGPHARSFFVSIITNLFDRCRNGFKDNEKHGILVLDDIKNLALRGKVCGF